ncbi:vWA domain-containing protein [Aquisphaera insulae]|uniref:vWA domain-containing protein n=1 Tax=Aquisphaera insulae TaxID=2712864 RepID=UPI0013EA8AA2|nr:vWA domain-containing protein [Aquisphaera insulae]
MLAKLVRTIDARAPWLTPLLGGRLDLEIPAYMVSLSIHLTFLVVLALVGHSVHQASSKDLAGSMVDSKLDSESTFQDLDQKADVPPVAAAAGTFAPTLASTITSAPSSAGAAAVSSADAMAGGPELPQLDIRRASELIVPTATILGQNVSIKGSGSEHVGSVEGAVDRIAVEILRRLEQGKTLVVWTFDASGSLQAERERLKKHIEAIYAHIEQLDESHLAADRGLLTLVVAFGQDRKAMTPKPTAELSEVLEAIGSVPTDESGVETTFGTVGEIVRRWGRYKDSTGQAYHPMIIVVTDEVGDDEDRLEESIELAVKAKVPVYVLGSQAIFGRVNGYMAYTDPKTKRYFPRVAVRQGPESAFLEQIHLPFWYSGPQYDVLEAGFGPYALSRLASATGGIYFVTRFTGQHMGFDPMRMKEYKPDWVRRDQYEAAVAKSPLRQAVVNASVLMQEQQKLPGMPSLNFPAVEDPAFKDVMAANQAVAERTAYTVDEALGPINAAAKLRDRETSRRWQAHYDLIRGRLLAMKVRCYEYNWACARLKKDMPKFKEPRANTWRLVPDTSVQYSEKAAAAARDAQRLLKRVIDEHPETPWALLAQRELKDPLGFKWVETYVPPPPPRNETAEAKKKMSKKAEEKPIEPPKL